MLRLTRPTFLALALAGAMILPAAAEPVASQAATRAVAEQTAARTAALGPVALKRPSLVSSDVVRLGDLFTGLSAEQAGTPIARAPKLGEKVPLDASWLGRLAAHYSVDWRPRSHLDGTVVERQAIVIGPDDIEAELLSLFDQESEGESLEISVENRALAIPLPLESEGRFGLEGLHRDRRSGRFTVNLVYPAEGTPTVRVAISGRVYELVEVPVLLHRVGGDEIIGPDDIGWETRRADRLNGNLITDPGQMVGQSPKRSLRPGQPVRAGDLRAPVLVPRNGLVTLRLRTGSMTLTVQGRALDEGGLGSVVRVVNLKSKTIVEAVVAEAGYVEVGGRGPTAFN